MSKKIIRGDIYFVNLDFEAIGSEQTGKRPVVILQNNVGNYYSPTVIVAPITSKVTVKSKIPTHIIVPSDKYNNLPKISMILLEQLRVIDKSRLGEYVGSLQTNVMELIDKALLISLGIKN